MSLLLTSSLFNQGESSVANDIVQTAEGDYIIVGRIYNVSGPDCGFIIKMTPSGVKVWERTYCSAFPMFFSAVTRLVDGSYAATGSYFYSNSAGDEYLWVVKFDEEGNITGQSAYGVVGIQSDGYSIEATKDGGFVVSGVYIEEVPSTYVLKFNAEGNREWDKKYDMGVAFSIVQTMDAGYALVGRSNASGGEDSLQSYPFILRLDPKGDIVWENTYQEYPIYVMLKGDIIETSIGHIAIVAKNLLMEVDGCGNKIFAYVNENFRLDTILQTSEGNYGVCGNVVVNDFEHAYIAVLNRAALIDEKSSAPKIIWDNIDIEYNSGFNRIIEDTNKWLVGCGYVSINAIDMQCFFSIFDPNQSLI